MSTYIQWSLYGRKSDGQPLQQAAADQLCTMLDEEVTEWHTSVSEDECIAQFLTTYNNAYSSIMEIVVDFARTVPDCVFQLFCHNEDENWYQQIHFCCDDCEVLNGQIVYDSPQRIFYETFPKEEEL